MSSSREIKQLQKAKSKAQSSNNLKEEANICNQLGELLARNGDYETAIREHQQELALSEVLNDVIGRAVASRKIGECYAEMGNIEAALKHQQHHLDLARSVRNHAEEQRALATIGRTYLFSYESDQSRSSLEQAEDAFRRSLAIVDECLEGSIPQREISEMKAGLFLNLGLVCDHLGQSKRCSEFIRRSVFIAEKSHLLEDLYRANFNLGIICFRNSQPSNAVRYLDKAKECARKIKNKFSESECFHCIGKVQLSLGDFVAARRSLKKALLLGSQQPLDRQAVKKAFRYADKGCKLEEEFGEDQGKRLGSRQAVELAEQLGDLYCKVGCYSKALDAYKAQLRGAEALGKPARELAVMHVSLAVTYTDLRQHSKAVEHYRQELALRQGSSTEECSTWLNIAAAQEESGCAFEDVDSSYSMALRCAQKSGQARLQKRVLRLWLVSQRRSGSSNTDETEARLQQLCVAEGWSPDGSDGEEDEEEEMDNSEPLDDSDVILSDSDDDLEGYDKMVPGRRKAGRWNKRNEKGETSLHRACIDGNLKQVQYLVEQGHPVNPRDYCGWTPLHEACNHGHYDIVAVLLDRGANINDPGGPLCDGVTPLHDALACGNFTVARLLVERGASVTLRNSKGETAMDTLRQWQRTYSRELDQDTRQECIATERLLRKALAGGGPAALATAKPFDALQDSQLFDAENSVPLSSPGGDCSSSQDWPRNNRNSEVKAAPGSPRQRHSSGSSRRHRARRTNAAVLYGSNSSSSDDSDSDCPISPLRPVRPSPSFPAAPSQKEAPPNKEVGLIPNSSRESVREAPAPSVFAREEYQSAIRGLGSAKTLQGLSQPQFSSTPPVSSSKKSALVPEEECLADDWLEDDMGDSQPKKKRRLRVEENGMQREGADSFSAARSQNRQFTGSAVPSSSSRSLSMRNNSSQRPHQVKMTQLPGRDQDTRQECIATERLLRKALAGGGPAALATAKPFDALQDSQLFDAENSVPLSSPGGDCSSSQDWPRNNRNSEVKAAPGSPRQRHSSGSSRRHRARRTNAAVLYGSNSSSSDDSDSDCPISPLRPVRPRPSFPAAPSQKEAPPNKEVGLIPNSSRESVREAPAPSVFAREEYQSAIRGLGSAKTLQGLSQPQFSSTPSVSSSKKSALVPEEECMADDWLEDDMGDSQPKKKRRLRVEENGMQREGADSFSAARSQNRQFTGSAVPSSSSRSLSMRNNSSQRPHQVKMTQLPGMVRLGRREVSRSHSPTVTDDDTPPPQQIRTQPLPQTLVVPMPTSLPPPIRVRVRVQEDVFLIPVPQSEADSCTVSWLCEQAAQRYYQKCGLLPRLSLQKEGALLSPQDLLLAVLHTNEEVRKCLF
uniref:LOW QUALITY PROTEIN: tonsoku-like protein n=1 Tax=Monopterus albus TaxID=43700 RepID=UPI0009B4138E|nr:LOW QUALITY PROTEIN: tonsoku-like protein [Monopterus albus]